LLGTLKPSADSSATTSDDQAKSAIVRIERMALPSFSNDLIATTKLMESNDIVSSLLATNGHSFIVTQL
jgi:hypothetical protein